MNSLTWITDSGKWRSGQENIDGRSILVSSMYSISTAFIPPNPKTLIKVRPWAGHREIRLN